MMSDSITWALCLAMLVCVTVQAKLREPLPFEDKPTLHVFEAEPAPDADAKDKDMLPALKAHVYHPQAVVTEGKYYADAQSLIMTFTGFKNVPVSLDYPVGDVKAGEYRWYASLAIGGKAGQTIEVLAGPDIEHLTPRGTIKKSNTASWKNDWFTCDKPVHIDAADKVIRYTFTGGATNRKIIDALVLEPLGQ
jgi:hypothetical protein